MNWTNGMIWQIKLDKKEYQTIIWQTEWIGQTIWFGRSSWTRKNIERKLDEQYDIVDQVGEERI